MPTARRTCAAAPPWATRLCRSAGSPAALARAMGGDGSGDGNSARGGGGADNDDGGVWLQAALPARAYVEVSGLPGIRYVGATPRSR